MEYFEDIVDIIENNMNYVLASVVGIIILEFIIFALCSIKKGFKHDELYVTIITTLLVTVGLYVVLCLGFGFYNYCKYQTWHIWDNFIDILKSKTFLTIAMVIMGVISIILFIILLAKLGIIAGYIVAALISPIATAVLLIAISLVIIIGQSLLTVLKLLWFIITAFFESFVRIMGNHGLQLLICIVVPCILFGAIFALKNYIKSFKEEVL